MPSSSAPGPFRAKQRPPVKPQSGKPPGSPMAGNHNPFMRSDDTMGGKTPNMVPPAKNTSFMADGGLADRRMFNDGRRGQAQGGMPPGSAPTQRIGPNAVRGQVQSNLPPGSPPRQGIGPSGVRGQAQGGMPMGSPPAQHLGMRHMADGGAPDDFGAPGGIGDAGPPPAAAPPPPDAAAPPDNDADDMQGGGASSGITPQALDYHDDKQECQGCQYMDEGGNCSVLKMQVAPEGWCKAYSGKMGDQDMGDMGGMGGQPGEDNGGGGAGTSASFGQGG